MRIKAWSPVQLGKVPELILFLYVRVSLGRDVMDSPEMQITNGELTAKLRGGRVLQIVRDVDESGRFFGDRKVAWMIEQVRKGAAHGIIVLDTSRWGRNLTESRQYVKELYDAGGVLISTTQPIDPTTADGLMIMNHFMNMDEHQGNKIGEKWVDTHKMRRSKGKPHHGREVFGYSRCPDCRRSERNKRAYEYCHSCKGILQPIEWMIPHYQYAFRRYNQGIGFRTIVKELRAHGVKSSKGNDLSVSTLRAAMDSGFAAGLIRVNDDWASGRVAGPWGWAGWIRGQHKRIISLGTWMRYVQRRRKQVDPNFRLREPAWELSTLMRCGVVQEDGEACKATMHVNPSGKYNSYRCSRESNGALCLGVTMGRGRAESLVLDWVESHASGEAQALIAMQRSAQASKDIETLKQLEKQEKKLKRRHDVLVDALLDGTFTKEQVKKKQAEIEAEMSVLEGKLAMIREAVTSNSAPPAQAFQNFLKLWPRLTVEEKQRALRQIIDHVIVHKTPGQAPNTITVVPKWAPLDQRIAGQTKNWDRIRTQRLMQAA